MAYVLGISGSPRKGGNSECLLDSFLKGARTAGHRVEKLRISRLKINPCDESNFCHKKGYCNIKDNMIDIYKKLLLAEYLVVATPIFFMGIPAQLKAMIDRCQAIWAKRFILNRMLKRRDNKNRYGFLLATSGLNKDKAFIGARETIKSFFYVLGLKYKGEVLVKGVDRKGDIKERKDVLKKACKLGKDLDII